VSDAGVVAIVLAAGSAGRFGSPKQCLPVDGVPLVRRAAMAGLAVGAVVVITGAHADAVADALRGLRVEMLHNPQWADGMGTSIACGIRHVAQGSQERAALICLSDQPLVGADQLQRLIDAHRETPEQIIASDHGLTLGPPCIFPRRFFPELTQLAAAHGARHVLARHAADVRSVAMPEASIDIDTPEDLQRLNAEVNRRANRE
jgi:CTP:molybdopterin cytidylyltransferase MocA